MTIQLGYDLINELFGKISIFDSSWIISILLTVLTMLLLTRDTREWKQLAFPIMVGWHVAGVTPSILIYIGTAILFVVDVLSLEMLTGMVLEVRRQFKGTGTLFTKTTEDIQSETMKRISEAKRKGATAQHKYYNDLNKKKKEELKRIKEISQIPITTTKDTINEIIKRGKGE